MEKSGKLELIIPLTHVTMTIHSVQAFFEINTINPSHSINRQIQSYQSLRKRHLQPCSSGSGKPDGLARFVNKDEGTCVSAGITDL